MDPVKKLVVNFNEMSKEIEGKSNAYLARRKELFLKIFRVVYMNKLMLRVLDRLNRRIYCIDTKYKSMMLELGC